MVARQASCGVDIVNDGEFGKPSYSTYVKDRLDGFGGESAPMNIRDFTEYPGAEEQLMNDPGFTHLVRPACVGPVSRRPEADEVTASEIALLKHAVEGVDISEAFMTAVSPARSRCSSRTSTTRTRRLRVRARRGDEARVQGDRRLRPVLQIDCPDLGCGAHAVPRHAARRLHARRRACTSRRSTTRSRDIPPDGCGCTSAGATTTGPHHRDVALRRDRRHRPPRQADGLSFEGANPRHEHEWQVFERRARCPRARC